MDQNDYAALYRDLGILEAFSNRFELSTQTVYMGALKEIEGLFERVLEKAGGVVTSAVPQLHVDE